MNKQQEKIKDILENFMIWYEHDDAARQKMSECIETYVEEKYYE